MSGSYDGSMIDVSSDSFWEVGLALKFNSQDGKNIFISIVILRCLFSGRQLQEIGQTGR